MQTFHGIIPVTLVFTIAYLKQAWIQKHWFTRCQYDVVGRGIVWSAFGIACQ